MSNQSLHPLGVDSGSPGSEDVKREWVTEVLESRQAVPDMLEMPRSDHGPLQGNRIGFPGSKSSPFVRRLGITEVRVFARLKQFFPNSTRLELKSGTTAGRLLEELAALKPEAAAILQASSIAVAGQLLDRKDLIDDYELCYVLPPPTAGRMITHCPIRIEEQLATRACPQAGAWNIFAGTPRDEILSRSVSYVEYEAFEPLAERLIADIVEGVKEKFRLVHASCLHRIGRVPVGEVALLIVTASRHRDAAFLGNNHILESVKQQTPIWKKYYWEDGSCSLADKVTFPQRV